MNIDRDRGRAASPFRAGRGPASGASRPVSSLFERADVEPALLHTPRGDPSTLTPTRMRPPLPNGAVASSEETLGVRGTSSGSKLGVFAPRPSSASPARRTGVAAEAAAVPSTAVSAASPLANTSSSVSASVGQSDAPAADIVITGTSPPAAPSALEDASAANSSDSRTAQQPRMVRRLEHTFDEPPSVSAAPFRTSQAQLLNTSGALGGSGASSNSNSPHLHLRSMFHHRDGTSRPRSSMDASSHQRLSVAVDAPARASVDVPRASLDEGGRRNKIRNATGEVMKRTGLRNALGAMKYTNRRSSTSSQDEGSVSMFSAAASPSVDDIQQQQQHGAADTSSAVSMSPSLTPMSPPSVESPTSASSALPTTDSSGSPANRHVVPPLSVPSVTVSFDQLERNATNSPTNTASSSSSSRDSGDTQSSPPQRRRSSRLRHVSSESGSAQSQQTPADDADASRASMSQDASSPPSGGGRAPFLGALKHRAAISISDLRPHLKSQPNGMSAPASVAPSPSSSVFSSQSAIVSASPSMISETDSEVREAIAQLPSSAAGSGSTSSSSASSSRRDRISRLRVIKRSAPAPAQSPVSPRDVFTPSTGSLIGGRERERRHRQLGQQFGLTPAAKDRVDEPVAAAVVEPARVFGVALARLELEQAEEGGYFVPVALRKLCSTLRKRDALKLEGLFRIAGPADEQAQLIEFLDRGGAGEIPSKFSTYTLGSTLRAFFKQMPEPLFTFALFPQLVDVMHQPDHDARVAGLCALLARLPQLNRHTIHYFITLLQAVASHASVTLMTASSLSTIFGPSLIRGDAYETDLLDLAVYHSATAVIRVLIEEGDELWPAVSSPRGAAPAPSTLVPPTLQRTATPPSLSEPTPAAPKRVVPKLSMRTSSRSGSVLFDLALNNAGPPDERGKKHRRQESITRSRVGEATNQPLPAVVPLAVRLDYDRVGRAQSSSALALAVGVARQRVDGEPRDMVPVLQARGCLPEVSMFDVALNAASLAAAAKKHRQADREREHDPTRPRPIDEILRMNMADSLLGQTTNRQLAERIPPPDFWRTAFFVFLAATLLAHLLCRVDV